MLLMKSEKDYFLQTYVNSWIAKYNTFFLNQNSELTKAKTV